MLIPAGNPSLWTGPTGNNTYLLTGASPALIDAGVGHEEHLAAVVEALGSRALACILITHSHSDHTKGLPALLERWPDVRVRNHGGDVCVDGERIVAGSRQLVALHTPGHAPDHFSFFDEEAGELYCGDLARLGGTIVVPASRGGSLREYLASLQRVRALRPARLLPGHGPAIDDPVSVIDSYLRHREMRERQIVGALQRGPSSPEEIVATVHGSLHPTLERAAVDSVLAHLIKLEEESRAERVGDGRWRLL